MFQNVTMEHGLYNKLYKMIKYGKYTIHSFLSPRWCKRLTDAGIDMKDAVWYYIKKDDSYYILDKDEAKELNCSELIPTYTLADILYLLNEYPFVDDSGAPLGFIKDAPFYIWTYYFNNKSDDSLKLPTFTNGKSYIEAEGETPLEAAARMLMMCKTNNIGLFHGFEDKYDEIWVYEEKVK